MEIVGRVIKLTWIEKLSMTRSILLVMCFLLVQRTYAGNCMNDSLPVNGKDVESVDAIIHSLYQVISGPAGEKRNWERLRYLFIEEGRMIPTGRKADGSYVKKVLTVEEYIASSGPYIEKEGFYEEEIGRKTEMFGNIAHVFSTYAARKKPDEPAFMRGINSIQLWNDGKRWWIISVFWQPETKETPLPSQYLN
jgi:hypothetical protein